MAGAKAPKERAPHRHWPMAEKRRIVELTLRPGTSLVAIAREHDVNSNNVYRWKRLYRAGKLDAPGAMFTASHNPAQYNGLKFCLAGARGS